MRRNFADATKSNNKARQQGKYFKASAHASKFLQYCFDAYENEQDLLRVQMRQYFHLKVCTGPSCWNGWQHYPADKIAIQRIKSLSSGKVFTKLTKQKYSLNNCGLICSRVFLAFLSSVRNARYFFRVHFSESPNDLMRWPFDCDIQTPITWTF